MKGLWCDVINGLHHLILLQLCCEIFYSQYDQVEYFVTSIKNIDYVIKSKAFQISILTAFTIAIKEETHILFTTPCA